MRNKGKYFKTSVNLKEGKKSFQSNNMIQIEMKYLNDTDKYVNTKNRTNKNASKSVSSLSPNKEYIEINEAKNSATLSSGNSFRSSKRHSKDLSDNEIMIDMNPEFNTEKLTEKMNLKDMRTSGRSIKLLNAMNLNRGNIKPKKKQKRELVEESKLNDNNEPLIMTKEDPEEIKDELPETLIVMDDNSSNEMEEIEMNPNIIESTAKTVVIKNNTDFQIEVVKTELTHEESQEENEEFEESEKLDRKSVV